MSDKPLEACEDCGHFACVCAVLAKHRPGCPYRWSTSSASTALMSAPTCDPCTCA